MPYNYIERTYGTRFQPGDRVRHSVTGKTGKVLRTKGDPHYYRVKFHGNRHGSNCHPLELKLLTVKRPDVRTAKVVPVSNTKGEGCALVSLIREPWFDEERAASE